MVIVRFAAGSLIVINFVKLKKSEPRDYTKMLQDESFVLSGTNKKEEVKVE